MTLTIQVAAAPLVFARTAYIDFRPDFIGAPRGMPVDQRRQALKFVQASLDVASDLDDGPRWVIFATDSYLVAGVAALAMWLSDQFANELATDVHGQEYCRRPLFGFVGLAFRRQSSVTFLPSRDRQLYRSVYEEVVGPRYLERHSDRDWQLATETEDRDVAVTQTAGTSGTVEVQHGCVRLHPIAHEGTLWEQAASWGRLSLCTRASPLSRDQLATFDLVTRSDVGEVRDEHRPAAPHKHTDVRPSRSPPKRVDRSSRAAMEAYDKEQEEKKKGLASISTSAFLGLAGLSLAVIAVFLIVVLRR